MYVWLTDKNKPYPLLFSYPLFLMNICSDRMKFVLAIKDKVDVLT